MTTYKPVHILSGKSIQQQRNVFIWCTDSCSLALGQYTSCFGTQIFKSSNTFPGWRVDNDSPITVSTAYRWITDAVLSQSRSHTWREAERFTLFPVEIRPSMVLTYSVHKNGPGLSRESQGIIPPGDYGVYTIGKNTVLCTTVNDFPTQETPHFTIFSNPPCHFRLWKKECEKIALCSTPRYLIVVGGTLHSLMPSRRPCPPLSSNKLSIEIVNAFFLVLCKMTLKDW
jgi:hypothetical protein